MVLVDVSGVHPAEIRRTAFHVFVIDCFFRVRDAVRAIIDRSDLECLGFVAETLQIRSINDCPYGVANSEETVDDENVESGSADLGWMYAAYVNENHPQLEKILQEALGPKIVHNFSGYQSKYPARCVKQVVAI